MSYFWGVSLAPADSILMLMLSATFLRGILRNISENNSYNDSWTVGEWLINYAGGFVRRGLPGSGIYHLTVVTGVNPENLVLAISLLFFAILVVFLCWRRELLLHPLVILSSVGLLGPLTTGNLVRKDFAVLVLLLACLLILRAWWSRRWSRVPALIMINIISVMGILSHEIYGFLALPILTLIAGYLIAQDRNYHLFIFWKGLIRAFLFLLPTFTTFFLVLQARGNSEIAHAIHNSWVELADLMGPSETLNSASPDGAIEALARVPGIQFAKTYKAFKSFEGPIWVPLAWLITAIAGLRLLLAGFGHIAMTNINYDRFKLRRFSLLVASIQIIAIAPLFILGTDYGRWLSFWYLSTLLIVLVWAQTDLINVNQYSSVHLLIPTSIYSSFIKVQSWLCSDMRLNTLRWLVILLGIPEHSWSIMSWLAATPIGYLIYL
ncbi:MAG: hypothetical protein AB8B32_07590 [Prochlorococcus sp.]